MAVDLAAPLRGPQDPSVSHHSTADTRRASSSPVVQHLLVGRGVQDRQGFLQSCRGPGSVIRTPLVQVPGSGLHPISYRPSSPQVSQGSTLKTPHRPFWTAGTSRTCGNLKTRVHRKPHPDQDLLMDSTTSFNHRPYEDGHYLI